MASRWPLTTVIALGAVVMVVPFAWLVIATTHSTATSSPIRRTSLPGSEFWNNLKGLFQEAGFGKACATRCWSPPSPRSWAC